MVALKACQRAALGLESDLQGREHARDAFPRLRVANRAAPRQASGERTRVLGRHAGRSCTVCIQDSIVARSTAHRAPVPGPYRTRRPHRELRDPQPHQTRIRRATVLTRCARAGLLGQVASTEGRVVERRVRRCTGPGSGEGARRVSCRYLPSQRVSCPVPSPATVPTPWPVPVPLAPLVGSCAPAIARRRPHRAAECKAHLAKPCRSGSR